TSQVVTSASHGGDGVSVDIVMLGVKTGLRDRARADLAGVGLRAAVAAVAPPAVGDRHPVTRAGRADVGRGAGIPVVARRPVGRDRADAPARDALVIGGTILPVVAGGPVRHGGPGAAPAEALVATGAGFAVVARRAVGKRAAPDAGAGLAGIGLRAGVAVVACGAVGLGGVRAHARRRVARARVVALIRRRTGDGVRARARAALAGVALRAEVAVVTPGAVGLAGVRAQPRRRVAGARVVALIRRRTGDGGAARARAALAGV